MQAGSPSPSTPITGPASAGQELGSGTTPPLAGEDPAQLPNLGWIYVLDIYRENAESNYHSLPVIAIKPDGTTATISARTDTVFAVVAPPGTPNAGTLYLGNRDDNSVTAIQPDGTAATIHLLEEPTRLARVSPAGTPNAGTVYVLSEYAATAIAPDHSTSRIALPAVPGFASIAPAGSPNTGTVYVANYPADGGNGNSLTAIKPDGTTSVLAAGVVVPGRGLPIAPAGTPNAGTVYVINNDWFGDGNTVTSIGPDGSTTSTTVGRDPGVFAFAGPGTPNAGTFYVHSSDGTVTAIKPDGTSTTAAVVPEGSLARMAVAPEGTPNAGILYILYVLENGEPGAGATVTAVKPDGTSTTTGVTTAGGLAIAPAGTANAGTVYVGGENAGRGAVTALRPDGSTITTNVGGDSIRGSVIAQEHTPNAGTVYCFNDRGGVTAIQPDGGSSVIVADAIAQYEPSPGRSFTVLPTMVQ